jgi:hypothetical protein
MTVPLPLPELATGWICSDKRYDYDYAPRLEHYFDGVEWSYCGQIGLWATSRELIARRRCKLCTVQMIQDGLLRVVAVRKGAW